MAISRCRNSHRSLPQFFSPPSPTKLRQMVRLVDNHSLKRLDSTQPSVMETALTYPLHHKQQSHY